MKRRYGYLIGYIRNVFFKLIILFLLNLFIFGLYFTDFFRMKFIVFSVLLIIDLYLIRKLLLKRVRLEKLLVVSVVIVISFLVAQNFSGIIENLGVNNIINNFGGNSGLSDKLLLSGTEGMLKTNYGSGREVIESIGDSITHSKEGSKEAFNYVNELRLENGLDEIPWDDRIYELAKYKAEDLTARNYFDHVDPNGKCVGSYAQNFGLNYPQDSFAENIFGYSTPTFFDQKEAVDSWMESRGHRYNLLYFGHTRGAFACDMKNCVFIGQGGEGWTCNTGEEGSAFWNVVGEQLGEVN